MKDIQPNSVGLFESVNVVKNEMVQVSLGNGSMFQVILNWIDGYLWVGIVGKGCYGFSKFAHYGYVGSKLNLGNDNDAKHMADFINDQIGISVERQGQYCVPEFN